MTIVLDVAKWCGIVIAACAAWIAISVPLAILAGKLIAGIRRDPVVDDTDNPALRAELARIWDHMECEAIAAATRQLEQDRRSHPSSDQ